MASTTRWKWDDERTAVFLLALRTFKPPKRGEGMEAIFAIWVLASILSTCGVPSFKHDTNSHGHRDEIQKSSRCETRASASFLL